MPVPAEAKGPRAEASWLRQRAVAWRLHDPHPLTEGRLVAITEVRQVDRQRQSAPRATRTLAELSHGPEAFRLLVEAVTDYAIFLVGPDGHVLTCNLGAERIKGYKANEIIGQHISVFYTAEDRRNGRPERNLREAARRGGIEDQGWRVRKDGT